MTRRTRRLSLVKRSVAVLVVAWLAACSWSLWQARASANRGLNGAESLSATFTTVDSTGIAEVRSNIATAQRRLDDPWLLPLKQIPLIGRQITTVEKLASGSISLVDAGNDALSAIDRADASNARDSLETARLEIRRALDAVQSIETPGASRLIGPVASARSRFVEVVQDIEAELTRADALAAGFTSLLDGETRYLLAAANTSEMGDAIGMTLSIGRLSIDDGRILVSDFESVSRFNRPSGVPIEPEVRFLWPTIDTGTLWQYSTHLSGSAAVASRILVDAYESAQAEEVDGIIIVDPVALQLFLEAASTSSVDVGDYEVATDNLSHFFGIEQYKLFDEDSTVRKEALATVAAAAMSALFEDGSDPRAIMTALLTALDERHIVLWSKDSSLQALWSTADATGELAPTDVKIGLANSGRNKLDGLLEVDSTIRTSSTGFTIDVTVHNSATGEEPSYVLGQASPGAYAGHLIVHVPPTSIDVSTSGDSPLNASGPDHGSHAFVFIARLAPGETKTWTLDVTVPSNLSEITVEPSSRYPSVAWTVDGEARPDSRFSFSIER